MELCDGKGDTAVKILVHKKEASQEGKLCVLSFYGKQIVKKKKKKNEGDICTILLSI